MFVYVVNVCPSHPSTFPTPAPGRSYALYDVFSQKSYWKIIRVINKSRTPKAPPLLVNNVFILDCKEKAKLFNDFFSNQCRLIANSSVLPTFNFLTDKRIDQIPIKKDEIVFLVRNLNHLYTLTCGNSLT